MTNPSIFYLTELHSIAYFFVLFMCTFAPLDLPIRGCNLLHALLIDMLSKYVQAKSLIMILCCPDFPWLHLHYIACHFSQCVPTTTLMQDEYARMASLHLLVTSLGAYACLIWSTLLLCSSGPSYCLSMPSYFCCMFWSCQMGRLQIEGWPPRAILLSCFWFHDIFCCSCITWKPMNMLCWPLLH